MISQNLVIVIIPLYEIPRVERLSSTLIFLLSLDVSLSPLSGSGTTCLVALLSDKELTVANVGDSRGVLCDKDGNAIPLSHDHKPYQLKERKRIKKAGERPAVVRTGGRLCIILCRTGF